MGNNQKKITFIGGGSYQWVPVLFRDIAVNKDLQNIEFVLYDIDEKRNNDLFDICTIINQKVSSSVNLFKEIDLEKALINSDIVVLCISTGGLDAMEHDIEIPKKYGIYQPVGDSTGPGGISRTLRNVPVVVEIAKKVEKICPNAWMINLSNPMDQITRSIHKATSVKIMGLCHEYQGFMESVEKLLKLKDWKKETKSVIAGVNHFSWILELIVNGQKDGLELFYQASLNEAQDKETDNKNSKLVNVSHSLSKSNVKLSLYEIYNAMPYPGDRHIVEFFPYFVSEKTEYGKKYGVELTSINDRRTVWIDNFKKRIKEWTSDKKDSVPMEPSAESLSPIIAALLGGEPTRQPICLPNSVQISNLPQEAVVETWVDVTEDKVTPASVGELDYSILALMHKHCINQELTVEGALTGNKKMVLQAMLADPLNNSNNYGDISQMLDELLEANKQLLPQFFK